MIPQSRQTKVSLSLPRKINNLVSRCFSKFNYENGTRIALDKKPVFSLFNIVLCAFQYIMVDQFTGAGFIFQDNNICPQRLIDAIKMNAQQADFFWRQRNHIQFYFSNECKRSFRTGDKFTKDKIISACCEGCCVYQYIESIARVSPFNRFFWKFFSYLHLVFIIAQQASNSSINSALKGTAFTFVMKIVDAEFFKFSF